MSKAAVAVVALLGVSALGAAAYAYESAKPISITLAPFPQQPNGTYTQSSTLKRTVGKQVVLTLPVGASWVGIVSNTGSGGSTPQLQVGGSSPFTYTINATDMQLVAGWTLNGTTYLNVFTFN